MNAAGGLLIVDKPAGLTSHDVVARVRRLAGTRRVGHAGTLDPAATGVLVLGIDKATKLLGYLALTDKDYTATIRLGLSTTTDDAQGEPITDTASPAAAEQTAHLLAAITDTDLRAAIATLTGTIEQIPSSVSAIKVDGQRAYARVRAGEHVDLTPRKVTVSVFDLVGSDRPSPQLLDLRVQVTCTSGTYIRALARDLGATLGVGGHLTALRRTRVGPYSQTAATALAELPPPEAGDLPIIGVSAAVDGSFPRLDVDADTARAVGFGQPVPAPVAAPPVPHGVFGPDGELLALMQPQAGLLRSLVVFAARS